MERITSRPTIVAEPRAKPGYWQSLLNQIAGIFYPQSELDQDAIERHAVAAQVEPEANVTRVAHDLPPQEADRPALVEPEPQLQCDVERELPDVPDDDAPVVRLTTDTEPVADGAPVEPTHDEPGTCLGLEEIAEAPTPELDNSASAELITPDAGCEGLCHDQFPPEPEVAELPFSANGEQDTTTAIPASPLDEPDIAEDEPTATTQPELEVSEIDTAEVPAPEPPVTELEEPDAQEPPLEPTLSEVEDSATTRSLWSSWFDRPRAWLSGKQELARKWIAELRSGRHEQVCGAWEDGTRECTIQVARNTFRMSYENLEDKFGERFLNEILHRNDRLQQPFRQIANFMEKELELDK